MQECQSPSKTIIASVVFSCLMFLLAARSYSHCLHTATFSVAYRHFGFVEEYLWQVLDPRPLPLGTAIWIVDLGGMGLSDLGSEAFQFYKRMSVEVGMHYPERLCKYACLSLPHFLHGCSCTCASYPISRAGCSPFASMPAFQNPILCIFALPRTTSHVLIALGMSMPASC